MPTVTLPLSPLANRRQQSTTKSAPGRFSNRSVAVATHDGNFIDRPEHNAQHSMLPSRPVQTIQVRRQGGDEERQHFLTDRSLASTRND